MFYLFIQSEKSPSFGISNNSVGSRWNNNNEEYIQTKKKKCFEKKQMYFWGEALHFHFRARFLNVKCYAEMFRPKVLNIVRIVVAFCEYASDSYPSTTFFLFQLCEITVSVWMEEQRVILTITWDGNGSLSMSVTIDGYRKSFIMSCLSFI